MGARGVVATSSLSAIPAALTAVRATAAVAASLVTIAAVAAVATKPATVAAVATRAAHGKFRDVVTLGWMDNRQQRLWLVAHFQPNALG